MLSMILFVIYKLTFSNTRQENHKVFCRAENHGFCLSIIGVGNREHGSKESKNEHKNVYTACLL